MPIRYSLVAALAGACLLAMAGAVVRAASVTIDQSGQQFSERSVTLHVGDSIVFANRDDVTHNVNIINEDDDATDLGLQKPGETLTYKFDKEGRFQARCSIHPGMKLTANVK
jgi:cytochrome c peroxidase